MIRVARGIRLSIAIVLVAGCTSNGIFAPPSGLSHAAATRTCAPTDGPAVAIYLSSAPVETLEPSTPYLRVAVWQPLEALSGRSWSVASGSTEGAAWFYATAGSFEPPTTGKVTVASVSADNRVEGTVDVTFPNAGRIQGGFRATWVSRAVLCG